MKKIVGIIAAVAMAASVFAVDFSAGARLEGNIFKYDGGTKAISGLNIAVNNQDYHKPFTFNLSTDNVGATVKIAEKGLNKTGDESTYESTTYRIWFKPFDAVKIELGKIDLAMHTESMGWYRRILNYDSWGYKVGIAAGDATIYVSLVPGYNKMFFSKPDSGDFSLAELNFAVDYNADFGNIMAMADFSDTFDTIKVAAGYKGTFGAISFFVDYMFTKAATNSNNITADFKYAQDAITFEAYTNVGIANSTSMALVARGTYQFDAFKTYLEFDCGNILADSFAAKIELGFEGNMGALGWEVKPAFNIGSNNFAVPFAVNVAF